MSLTKNDLSQIKEIVDDAKVELRQEMKSLRNESLERIHDIKNKLSQEMQDWRSEFFTKIDPILEEVTTNRRE